MLPPTYFWDHSWTSSCDYVFSSPGYESLWIGAACIFHACGATLDGLLLKACWMRLSTGEDYGRVDSVSKACTHLLWEGTCNHFRELLHLGCRRWVHRKVQGWDMLSCYQAMWRVFPGLVIASVHVSRLCIETREMAFTSSFVLGKLSFNAVS